MKVKKMILVATFAALTAIGAFVSIPLGFVSITLQSFFSILSGIFLGPKLGPLSQILYVGMGLIGIPIFSGHSGGFQYVYSPSFGFLIGFIFASYCAGITTSLFKDTSTPKILIASLLSTIVIYIFGLPYMYFVLNFITNSNVTMNFVLKSGFLLFLPGDILKVVLLSIIGKKVLPLIK